MRKMPDEHSGVSISDVRLFQCVRLVTPNKFGGNAVAILPICVFKYGYAGLK